MERKKLSGGGTANEKKRKKKYLRRRPSKFPFYYYSYYYYYTFFLPLGLYSPSCAKLDAFSLIYHSFVEYAFTVCRMCVNFTANENEEGEGKEKNIHSGNSLSMPLTSVG